LQPGHVPGLALLTHLCICTVMIATSVFHCPQNCNTDTYRLCAAESSSIMLISINVVAQRRARLVLGWVLAFILKGNY